MSETGKSKKIEQVGKASDEKTSKDAKDPEKQKKSENAKEEDLV